MSVKPLLDAFRDYLSLRDEPVVREWLDGFDWNISERNIVPVAKPASQYLESLSQHVGKGEERLVAEFIKSQPKLQWLQSYTEDDFGPDFLDHYAQVELIGERGHFVSNEIAGGFVLVGPNFHYPKHWHVAEAIYIPLTGGSHFKLDDDPIEPYKSGSLVHLESNTRYEVNSSDNPLLTLWIWRGGDLTQKSNY